MELLKKSYTYDGMNADRLLDKFEVTPGLDNYPADFDRHAFNTREPILYERPPKEEQGNYIPYDDHIVDDIGNNPEELYYQDARFQLADRNPDAPFLAADAPKRNPNMSRERLNLQYNNSRSNTGEMPNHSEIFIGDMEQDPRGWDTAPRFDKMREMLMGKTHMDAGWGEKRLENGAFKGGRAKVLEVNMGNNTVNRAGDGPKNGIELQEMRKQLQITKRDKAKIFDRQLISIAAGKNVSMGHPEYTNAMNEMDFTGAYKSLDPKNNVAMNDNSLASYVDAGDVAFGATGTLVNNKTMKYLSAEMACRALEDHEYGKEKQLSNKSGLAAGNDFVEAQQHVIAEGFHTSKTVTNRKARDINDDVLSIQHKVNAEFNGDNKQLAIAKTKGPELNSDAIFSYKVVDINYGTNNTQVNSKTKHLHETNDALHYKNQDQAFNTSRVVQNKKSMAPPTDPTDIIHKSIVNVDSRASSVLNNKKSANIVADTTYHKGLVNIKHDSSNPLNVKTMSTARPNAAEAQYKSLVNIKQDTKGEVFNYASLRAPKSANLTNKGGISQDLGENDIAVDRRRKQLAAENHTNFALREHEVDYSENFDANRDNNHSMPGKTPGYNTRNIHRGEDFNGTNEFN
jgi:hypothetical protein